MLYLDAPLNISRDHSESKHIKDRFSDNEKAIESIFNDVRSSGILVRDLTNNDSFKFAHKSFMEFLVAQYYYLMMGDGNSKFLSDGIYKALRFARIYDIEFSEEVISHISELMKIDNGIAEGQANMDICKGLIERINPDLHFINKYIYGRLLGVTCSAYYLSICLIFPYLIFVILPQYFGWSSEGSYITAVFVTLISLFHWRSGRQESINRARNSYSIWLGVCETFTDKSIALSCLNPRMASDLAEGSTVDKYLGYINYLADKIFDSLSRKKT